MNIFIDIETIPDQREGALQAYIDAVEAPGNYKKQESIAAWLSDNAKAEGEKSWRKTSFNAACGEICVIGLAFDGDEPIALQRDLGESERDLLIEFNDLVAAKLSHSAINPYFVGHNVLKFDLRFIWQRMVIHGVRPNFAIPHTDRPGGSKHFDTMFQWAGFGERISQDNLARALGLPGKPDDIDGSKVWDFVAAGNLDRVAEYCLDDVSQVRDIYARLTFSTNNKLAEAA